MALRRLLARSTKKAGSVAYAGYPDAVVYDTHAKGRKAIQHLLWGDWLLQLGPAKDGFVPVRARGCEGWVLTERVQQEPLLEITFVDIGQGDGCVISAPVPDAPGDGKRFRHLVVDAGERDNMRRYLRWRFNLDKRKKSEGPFTFDAAVITHPDQDHYMGFRELFEDETVSFGSVFHSGVLERADGLGEVDAARNVKPVLAHDELVALLDQPKVVGKKRYPGMLKSAIDSQRHGPFRGLSAGDYLPGFEAGEELSIEVLGPVPTEVAGQKLLRSFGDPGKTKNGHSVVLMLRYRQLKVLLGGDLNVPAEEHLLAHYGQDLQGDARLEEWRRRLGADVAKACHHGSADFSTRFLEAVKPAVTVISSGDDEPHAHPRADALGGLARTSRGPRPLIFSTELARSAKELIKHPKVLRDQYAKLLDAYDAAQGAKRLALRKRIDAKLSKTLERSVATYGAINLRSDGRRLVMAYRLERTRSGKRWDLYPVERVDGVLTYVSKHERGEGD